MATSFLKEFLLTQLCRLGIKWPPEKEEEKPVKVQQTLAEAGYCPYIPTDDIPVALIPGMLRLDKQSWLNALSIEASFSTDVEDGDLVYPVATNVSGDFISNIAELRDAVWKPVNQVSGTAPTDASQLRICGIAYTHIGRVMFGPVVFHQRFAFKSGAILYAGESGEITTTSVGSALGICVAPGSIFLDLSIESSKNALEALEASKDLTIKVNGLEERVENAQTSSTASIQAVVDNLNALSNELRAQLNNKLSVSGDASNTLVVASGSTATRTLSERFSDVVNVKDFGAVGDGVADDTEPIQKAARVAYNRDVVLYFPGGTYLITSDIEFKRRIVHNGSITICATLTGDVEPSVNVYFSSRACCDIDSINFTNVVVNIVDTTASNLVMDARITRCRFNTSPLICGRDDIITSMLTVSNCRFTNSNSRTFDAIKIVNYSMVVVDSSIFSDCSSCINITPSRSFACSNIKITNNKCLSYADQGITLSGTSMNRCDNITISNNIFAGTKRYSGTLSSCIFAKYCHNMVVSGNTLTSWYRNILLIACKKVDVLCNTIHQHAANSAVQVHKCTDVAIQNNAITVSDNGYAAFCHINTHSAVESTVKNCLYESQGFVFSDNIVNTYTRGIRVGSTKHVRIRSNVFKSSTTLNSKGFLFFYSSDGFPTLEDAQYYDNTFICAGGSPVNVSSYDSAYVTAGPDTQEAVITTPDSVNVAAPIIVQNDASFNNSNSYIVTFSIGFAEQLKAKAILQGSDVTNKQTLSQWMQDTPDAILAWNASAWDMSTGYLPDIVVNGGLYDSYGLENFSKQYLRSCMIIDRSGILTCRNFYAAAYSVNFPFGVGASMVAEDAWQSACFNCPLIVDGSIYDPSIIGNVSETSWNSDVSARMCLGQTSDKTFVLLAVDGASGVRGATMKQCAEKLLSLGCINAFNLDGGGSASLWYQGNIINNPSDADGLRPIPSIMYV